MDVTRTPWTEPYTVRERIAIRVESKRYDIKGWWRDGLWQWLAHRMPRRLVLFAYVRVMAHAWAESKTKVPNEITYEEAYKLWENC